MGKIKWKTQAEITAEQNAPKPPTAEERIAQLEGENVANMMAMTEMFEENIRLQGENTSTMLAVTELYELMLGGN